MPHDEFDRGVIRKRGPGIHETWVLYHRTRPRWTGEVHEKVHRVDGDNFSTWTCERVEIDVRHVKYSVRAVLDRIEWNFSRRWVPVPREGRSV